MHCIEILCFINLRLQYQQQRLRDSERTYGQVTMKTLVPAWSPKLSCNEPALYLVG